MPIRIFKSFMLAALFVFALACGDDDDSSSNNANNSTNNATNNTSNATNNANNSNNATNNPTSNATNNTNGGTNNATNNGEALEVVGTWSTQFMTTETITSSEWNGQDLVDYDNEANEAITFAGPDDEFNPTTYGKIVWTEIEGDTFYYCTVAFGLASESEARQAEDTADRNDLEGEGCSGFAWTRMTRE